MVKIMINKMMIQTIERGSNAKLAGYENSREPRSTIEAEREIIQDFGAQRTVSSNLTK